MRRLELSWSASVAGDAALMVGLLVVRAAIIGPADWAADEVMDERLGTSTAIA